MTKKIQKLDLIFLGILLSICLIANLTIRGQAIIEAGNLELAIGLSWSAVAVLWVTIIRWLAKTHGVELANNDSDVRPSFLSKWQSAYLALFTVAAFFIPLRKNFWHGYDEFIVCWYGTHPSAIAGFDHDFNRPFAFIQSYLENWLTPSSLDGYMWLALATHLLWGYLIYLILQELFPQAVTMGLIAALLLIASPADPLRYMMIILPGYYFTICTLMLSIWCYLRSYRLSSRTQLLLSCILLNYSMLAASEAGYPLAACVPILLWLSASKQSSKKFMSTWALAWFGTLSAPALRLIYFLATNHNAYQLSASGGKALTISRLIDNLKVQLSPIFNYFDTAGLLKYWPYGLFLMAVVSLLVMLPVSPVQMDTRQASRRRLFAGLLIAECFVLLGIVAFINFDYAGRTQFYSAPAQAALLAILIELCAAYFMGFSAHVFKVAVTAGIVAFAATGSMNYQDVASKDIRFGNVTTVFDQIHKIAPVFKPGTVVILVLQDRTPSMFGANYGFQCMINQVLGVNGFMVNFDDPIERNFVFRQKDATVFNHGKEGTSLNKDETPFPGIYPCPYDRLVVFLLSSNGQVSLLKELPKIITGTQVDTASYSPASRIETTKTNCGRLPYVAKSAWMPRTHYSDGIVVGNSPIILGKNWGVRHSFGDDDCHLITHDATIGFCDKSPLFQKGELVIDIAPRVPSNEKPMVISIVDDNQKILDSAKITTREVISLKIPRPDSSTILKLRCDAPELRGPNGDTVWNYRVQSIGYKNANL